MFFSNRFTDTDKPTSFTRAPCEPTHYIVLNPKPVLADTIHMPRNQTYLIFFFPVLKHVHSLKRPVFVHTLAVLPMLTYVYVETS